MPVGSTWMQAIPWEQGVMGILNGLGIISQLSPAQNIQSNVASNQMFDVVLQVKFRALQSNSR